MEIPIEQANQKRRGNVHTCSAGSIKELREKVEELGVTFDDAQISVLPRRMWGRNEPCPCKSGKKYKKCCIGKLGDTYIANIPFKSLQNSKKNARDLPKKAEKTEVTPEDLADLQYHWKKCR